MIATIISQNAKYYDIALKKKRVKSVLCGALEYKKWIILHDLLNCSYHYLHDGIRRNKITMEDIKEVVGISNNIEEIFDIDFIIEQVSSYGNVQ